MISVENASGKNFANTARTNKSRWICERIFYLIVSEFFTWLLQSKSITHEHVDMCTLRNSYVLRMQYCRFWTRMQSRRTRCAVRGQSVEYIEKINHLLMQISQLLYKRREKWAFQILSPYPDTMVNVIDHWCDFDLGQLNSVHCIWMCIPM